MGALSMKIGADYSSVYPLTPILPWSQPKDYDLYRKRFLWRFSFIRLRRLCLAILAFLLFFREPITRNDHAGIVWLPDQQPELSAQLTLINNFIQRVLDDALSAEELKFRDDLAHDGFVDIGFDSA